jgi:ankyrin repeat protein/L-ascorbate metabolism protein UlaG (beta-lactamase superfamily)
MTKRLLIVCFAFCLLAPVVLAGAEIHDAALNNDLVKVKELLAKDPSLLKAVDGNGRTALHLAVSRGHLELVAWLIKRSADVNQKEGSYQLTPLHLAVWNGHLEVARLLVKNGAALQAREKDNETVLYYVKNSLPLAKWLLAKGLALNDAKSSAGNTPFSIAIGRGFLDVAEYFLAKGADAKFKDADGMTALHMACWQGKEKLFRTLIKKGVGVDGRARGGITPLLLATMVGNLDAVKVLLENKADVTITDQSGLFPLLQAAKDGRKEIALRLLAAGANAKAVMGDTGLTALHMACALGYGDIARALLDKGADVNAKDKWEHTPIGLANRYGHRNLAELLLSHGAQAEKGPIKTADGAWLKKPLAKGEALVWYTDHSGWAVRTANHLLVFDYFKPDPPPDQPGIANGYIVPAEIGDLPVTVFVSHSHSDHYMPSVFEWKNGIRNIAYVAGFKPEGKDGYQVPLLREKTNVNGVEIIAIESNDSGQGYFVTVDGVAIFHPGDHANRQRDFSGPFKKEIDFLADQGLKADILFAPVSGCGFGDIVSVKKGVYYTIDRLSARHVFPMHAQGNPLQYQQFAKEAAERGYDNTFHCAEFPGDCYAVKAKEGNGQ